MKMQPAPSAQVHFAYSPTLRWLRVLPTSHHGTAFPTLESTRHAVAGQGSAGLWDRLLSTVKGKSGESPEKMGTCPLLRLSRPCRLPARAIFQRCVILRVCTSSLSETIPLFQGLRRTISDIIYPWLDRRCHPFRQSHSYNKFSVSSPGQVALKFTKYTMRVCSSSSAEVRSSAKIMGNSDDAVSITIAVVIVLTGMLSAATPSRQLSSPLAQSVSYRNYVLNSRPRRSTGSSLTIATSSAMESKYTFSRTRSSWATSPSSPLVTASWRTCAYLLPSTSR